jgi:TPP-dependent pyruvate/acetoin dehydrogenase alpha subunit
MHEIRMPAIGMAMTEATVTRWLRNPGDLVTPGDKVAEIETDKATMDLESPVAGRLGKHLFGSGAVVSSGTVIVRVLQAGEADEPGHDDSVASPKESQPKAADAPPRNSLPPDGGRTTARPSPRARNLARIQGQADEPNRVAASAPSPRATQKPVGTYKQGITDATKTELQPIDISDVSLPDLPEWLETMLLIREFEEACEPLSATGKIPGGMHSAAGQEGVAVGSIRALGPDDIVCSSHRSHHHSLAKGLSPESVMAELFGKVTGCLGGRGGHMHLADFSIGLYGSNGIVGGGLGLAMGSALAFKLQNKDRVALGFFGDGGASTGRIWEIVNMASIWQLPLIVICENNLYAVETHLGRSFSGESIAARAAGFGLPAFQADGQDVAAMYRATAEARQRGLRGEGPTFIEALTYRYRGHNTGDPQPYRDQSEVEWWRSTRDPILRLERALEGSGVLSSDSAAILKERARARVRAAVDFAERSGWPDPATAADNVTGLRFTVQGNL